MRAFATGLAVLGVSILAACAGGSGDPDAVDPETGMPPPNAWTTIASSTLSGRIVSMSIGPYPEGSIVTAALVAPAHEPTKPYNGKRFEAFVAKLGWPLPEPLEQPRRCPRGQPNFTVTVVFENGQSQFWGPCRRPAVVDLAVKELNAGY